MDQAKGAPLRATGERLVPELQHGELVHAEHLVRYLVFRAGSRSQGTRCGVRRGLRHGATRRGGCELGDRSRPRRSHHRPRSVASLGAGVHRWRRRRAAVRRRSSTSSCRFETIEHVPDPERALAELQRVSAPDGLLLVSTPNKHQYLVENEYHEREFFHEEFVELLHGALCGVEVLLQHNWLASAVLPVSAAADRSGELDHELAFHKLDRTRARTGALHAGAVRTRRVAAAARCRRGGDRGRSARARPAGGGSGAHGRDVARRVQAGRSGLLQAYNSVWWRLTAPPRRLIELVRRRLGG